MKKLLSFFLIAALVLTLGACGEKPAETPTAAPAPTAASEPSPAPTEAPATPAPEAEPTGEEAEARVDGLGAVVAYLALDETVKVTGEEGEYYTVERGGISLLAEKRLIRLETESFTPWTAFAAASAPVYEGVYMTGEARQTLPRNTRVTVLAELGECCRVALPEGGAGYIPTERLSRVRYSAATPAPSGGSDGGDIRLSGRIAPGGGVTRLGAGEAAYPLGGTVLAEAAEAYLRLLRRGERVLVTSREGTDARLWLDGQTCAVPAALLRFAGESAYEAWEGYAQRSALVYGSWRMTGARTLLASNTPLRVLEAPNGLYYVSWTGGAGYMRPEAVSAAPLPPAEPKAPDWTAPTL